MTEEFGNSIFERAQELPEEAVITRPVAETRGLQPEDLGVLTHLLLLPATAQASGKDLAAGMRALGWKMSIDRFEVIAKRLTAAGHLLRKSIYNPQTKRPEWRYWAYRNPANNPVYVQAGAEAFAQVRTENGENPVPEQAPATGTGKNPVSPGQSRNRGKPGSGGESGKTRFPSGGVSAGQSRNAENPPSGSPPPHPPEEVDTSSPLPPSDANGSLPSQREERAAESFPEERLAEARLFLSRLPRPWTVGRQAARRMAPLLLEAAEEQGWQLDEKLAAELTRNPEGVRNYVRALERARIPDLVRYEMVHGPGASQFEGASPAQGSGRESAQVRALRARIAREGTGL